MIVNVTSGTCNTNRQVPVGTIVCIHAGKDEEFWAIVQKAQDSESCLGCFINDLTHRDGLCPRTIEMYHRTHPCVLADCAGVFIETKGMEDI